MSFLKQIITSIFLIMIRIELAITDRYCTSSRVKVLHTNYKHILRDKLLPPYYILLAELYNCIILFEKKLTLDDYSRDVIGRLHYSYDTRPSKFIIHILTDVFTFF